MKLNRFSFTINAFNNLLFAILFALLTGCDTCKVAEDNVYKVEVVSLYSLDDNNTIWNLAKPIRIDNNKQNCFRPELYYVTVDSASDINIYTDVDTLLYIEKPGPSTNPGNESFINRSIEKKIEAFQKNIKNKPLKFSSDYSLVEAFAFSNLNEYRSVFYIGKVSDPDLLNAKICNDETEVLKKIAEEVNGLNSSQAKFLVIYAKESASSCTPLLLKKFASESRKDYESLVLQPCNKSQFKEKVKEYSSKLNSLEKLLKTKASCVELSKAKIALSKVKLEINTILIDCKNSDKEEVLGSGRTSTDNQCNYTVDLDMEKTSLLRDREKLRSYEILSILATNLQASIEIKDISERIKNHEMYIGEMSANNLCKTEYENYLSVRNAYNFGVKRGFERLAKFVEETCSSEYIRYLNNGKMHVENARKLPDDKKNRVKRINYLYNAINNYVNAETACPREVDLESLKKELEREFPEEYIFATKQ